MKSFSLLTAILFVIFGSAAWADDPAPADNVEPAPVEQPGSPEDEYAPAVMDGAYTDFPGYYPGYSSYRGLGYMGSCCEQNSCCAQYAWEGYCEQRGNGHYSPFHGWADRLRCHLTGPACCDKGCSQKGCCEEPCSQKAGCGAKSLHGLCGKRHGLRNRSGWWNGLGSPSYGEYYGPLDGEAMPTYTDPMPTDANQQILEPTPETSPEPPAEVTTDYVPTFSDPTSDDRSARRTNLRRLPEVL